MSLFPKQPDLVGLEVGKNTVKVAALKMQKKGWLITHLKEVPLGTPLDFLPKESVITTALDARQVLVRPFHMELTREKDLFSALDFQVETQLPFPADQGIVEAQIVEKSAKGTALALCAVKKDHLKAHIESFTQTEPEVVTNIYSALAELSLLLPESAHRLLLIHIGEKEVACALVERGKLLKAHAFDRAKEFQIEIKKTVLALRLKSFETIFLVGSEDPFFVDEIKKATGETPLYPVIPSLQLSQERLIKFGAAIGIALSGREPRTINFRKKDFSYPHPLKRTKKPLLLFFSLSIILSLSLFSLSTIALKREERHVADAYQTLLAAQGNFDANIPKSPFEYAVELQKIEKEVLSRPDTFPLLPGIPSVREVLTFVGGQAPQSGVVIESLRYQIVQRPSFGAPKERYRVRVDLAFSASSITQAKQLHEALIEPNDFVDGKSEISWESARGKYRTSFYLKDKTRYHG